MKKRESESNPLRRVRELLGFSTQKELADALGVLPQHVSRAERRERLSAPFESKLRAYLERREPGDAERVGRLLGGGLWLSASVLDTSETSKKKSGWEPADFPPIEREAWSWALSFRNSTVLEELAGRALQAGLSCTRLRDGIVLATETGERKPRHPSEPSVSGQPAPFGLREGTVVLLGAAERHAHSRDLIREFSKQLDLHIEFAEFADRKAYFGYPTVLKNLAVGRGAAGKAFHSSRYAEGDSVVYEDVAAIFHGPLDRFYGKEHHFGPEAKRIIVVAALQRLANGIGVRFLWDSAFREACLDEHRDRDTCDFEDDARIGLLVFRVTVVHSDYGNTIRKFEIIVNRHCRVDDAPR